MIQNIFFKLLSFSLFFAATFMLNNRISAQTEESYFVAPANINGVEITQSSTGSVSTYAAYNSCSVTTPNNAAYLGSTGAFTYTLNFSKAVYSFDFIVTATGNPQEEVFSFETNTGTPELVDVNSCYSRVEGNKLYSGLNSAANGGGGRFSIRSTKAFTSITIIGDGGLNGSIFAFCSSSFSAVCDADKHKLVLNKFEKWSECGASELNIKDVVVFNPAKNMELTWHNSVIPSENNQLDGFDVIGGRYYAAFYDTKNKCYSSTTVPFQANLKPKLNLDAGTNLRVNDGDSVTLFALGAINYTWNNNVIQNQTFVPSESKYYTVSATNEYGCSAKDSVYVEVIKKHIVKLEDFALENFDSTYFKPINVVFLLDVSSSMIHYDKFKLLKSSLIQMVNLLRPQDQISVVIYASDAKVLFSKLTGRDKNYIIRSIENIKISGKTEGLKAIKKGFSIAQSSYLKNGSNMVVLVSDGAFNYKNDTYLDIIDKYQQKNIQFSVVGIKNQVKDEAKMRLAAERGLGDFISIVNQEDASKNLILEMKKHTFIF